MNKLMLIGAGVVVVLVGLFISFKILKKISLRQSGLTYSNIPTNNSGSTLATGSNVSSGNITLEALSPTDGQTVTSPTVMISGKTTPNAEVSVNETDTKADASGKFSTTVNLDEGENVITVIANDQNGNFIEKELTITYTVSQ